MITFGTISAGALFILLVGILVKHFLAKDRRRQELFNEAAQRFKEAFTEEIQRLQLEKGYPFLILTPAFDKHNFAVTEFKSFLKGKKRRRFEEAWEKYCDCYHPKEDIYPTIMFGKVSDDVNELAPELIEKLLSFAKPK